MKRMLAVSFLCLVFSLPGFAQKKSTSRPRYGGGITPSRMEELTLKGTAAATREGTTTIRAPQIDTERTSNTPLTEQFE